MGHTYRYGNNANRHAHHIGFALGVIAGCNGQIAVGGGQRTLVDRNTGLPFRRQSRIAHAYRKTAHARLHRLEMDRLVFVFRYVTLVGCQRNTAAFHGRIRNRNIIQLVQMVDYVRHVHACNTHRTAASVEVRIVQFGIAYRQGTAGSFQVGTILHIGMHAGAPDIAAFGFCLNAFLHGILFFFFHAIEMFRKIAFGIIVYHIQYFINGTGMTEGSILPVSILGISQLVDTFIHRNSQYVHGDPSCADAYAGHGGIDLTLGFGVDGQGIFRLHRTLIHNGADGVIEGAHVHAHADACQQSACAGTGGVFDLQLVGGIHRNGIRRQAAAHDPAGHPAVNIVHSNTAGDTGAEYPGRHAYGNQFGFHCGFVNSANSQGRFGIRAAVGSLQLAVLHIGGDGRTFIHYAHAYVQGTGYTEQIRRNRKPRVYVQVIDGILMAGFNCGSLCVICRGVGHHRNGGTLHLVGIHIIAGFKGCK